MFGDVKKIPVSSDLKPPLELAELVSFMKFSLVLQWQVEQTPTYAQSSPRHSLPVNVVVPSKAISSKSFLSS